MNPVPMNRTPEDIVRRMTWDPTGTDPDPSPDPFPHEQVKWRGAIVFGLLAALAIGVGIGLALNP